MRPYTTAAAAARDCMCRGTRAASRPRTDAAAPVARECGPAPVTRPSAAPGSASIDATPVDAGTAETLCAILRERFGEDALSSACFPHFCIVDMVAVLARSIAATPTADGTPMGEVPPDVLCDAFEQVLALKSIESASPSIPRAKPAPIDAGSTPTEVPPGLTPGERATWERDGMFWRRGIFSAAQTRQMKAALRWACTEDGAPLGMVSGPGARVFFADDPTEPQCITDVATARDVLGPIGDLIGPDVDYLYTKAVYKDARTRTGFGWHWDHTYWGGVTKYSIWVALDDADVDNGCLMLVPGSHRYIPQLEARFRKTFRREREEEEDPWQQRSGKPATMGDDFVIHEAELDELLNEHGLRRETHRASAGDVLFFSSYVLHASHRNVVGSKDRWALIASYRDASADDACRVFPRPRAVLRRGCRALGRLAAASNRTSAEELAARYILPAAMEAAQSPF